DDEIGVDGPGAGADHRGGLAGDDGDRRRHGRTGGDLRRDRLEILVIEVDPGRAPLGGLVAGAVERFVDEHEVHLGPGGAGQRGGRTDRLLGERRMVEWNEYLPEHRSL